MTLMYANNIPELIYWTNRRNVLHKTKCVYYNNTYIYNLGEEKKGVEKRHRISANKASYVGLNYLTVCDWLPT